MDREKLNWWQKELLTLSEASELFGVGYKTLQRFLLDHEYAGLTIQNGTRLLVKREKFKRFIDDEVTVL